MNTRMSGKLNFAEDMETRSGTNFNSAENMGTRSSANLNKAKGMQAAVQANAGVRVLLIEDEAMLREALAASLAARGYEVLQAGDGSTALAMFEQEKPDFVILDLMLPDIGGEALCRQFRECSSVPILMLTAKAAEDDMLNGLQLGADDYMTKPFSLRELAARMEAILRRCRPDGAHTAVPREWCWRDEMLEIYPEQKLLRRHGERVELTPSEWGLLEALLRRPQKIFTREELILQAFGEDFDSSDRVIDTHIKNLRKKLEADSKNPLYIRTIHGLGYRFGGVC